MHLPHIVPNSTLKIFKFYGGGDIHEAVFHDGVILRLATIFYIDKRKEAYRFAYQLGKDYITLVSADPAIYRIWVDIQCPLDADWASYKATQTTNNQVKGSSTLVSGIKPTS